MSYVVRSAHAGDLAALYQMAKTTGGGFTNLPANRPALIRKLERAVESFTRTGEEPTDDQFVFVLENTATGKVIGTCQIFSRVGSVWPFYSYRLGVLTQYSEALNRTFRAQTLTLCTDLDGVSEVGGLFLHPGERAAGIGKLLAQSRYLFIGMHRARFATRTIAELRGAHDDVGGSPFWDGLAGRFFDMTFREADEFNGIHGNQFIADLMPKHTIYTAMISDSALAVMGMPHQSGRAAMRMLEEEGFAAGDYIDIFDGGPTMIAQTDRIRTLAASATSPLMGIADSGGAPALLAHGAMGDFRACMGQLSITAEGVVIDAASAALLRVELGDRLVHAPR